MSRRKVSENVVFYFLKSDRLYPFVAYILKFNFSILYFGWGFIAGILGVQWGLCQIIVYKYLYSI